MSDTPVHFFDIDSKLKGMTQLTCMHAFKHTHSQCLTALFISQGLRDLGLPTRTSFCSLKLVYFNDLTIVEFNSLKVRISLNYKQIPYTETFVSYPDIKPLLESLGHSDDPEKPYNGQTCPAIYHPDSLKDKVQGGQVMTEGLDIALHLDELYPQRPLLFPSTSTMSRKDVIHLAETVQNELRSALLEGHGFRIIAPKIPDILDDRGKEYFVRTRSTLPPFFKDPREWPSENPEEDWRAYEAALKPLADRLVKSGPFHLGDTFSFPDAVMVGHLEWLGRADSVYLEKVCKLYGGVFGKLYEQVKEQGLIDGRGEAKEWPVPGH